MIRPQQEKTVDTEREPRESGADDSATIAHELRRPLTSILGYARLLQNKADLDTKSQHYLQRIIDGAQQINELIDSYLPQEGEEPRAFSPAPCNLDELLLESAEVLEAQAEEQGVTLTVDVPDLPPIIGDDAQLTQVVTNLLDNAIKYTPAGGRVTLEADIEFDWVVIRVTDTGWGIAPSELERIWERDYRGQSARQASIEGSGLGLSIVRSIVHRHGGYVDVRSELGVGSTFIVRLSAWHPR